MDHNRVYHLEDMMIMYGKYNSDTLMELVKHNASNAKCYHMEGKGFCKWDEQMA